MVVLVQGNNEINVQMMPTAVAHIIRVALSNIPPEADIWMLTIFNWEWTEYRVRRDLPASFPELEMAEFLDVPAGWTFPLKVDLVVYRYLNGSLGQVYRVQSYREINPFTGEPDPDYKEVYIPSFGNFVFDFNTETFIPL